MALELLIVKIVDHHRLLWIAPNLLLPADKYLSLQIFDVVGAADCWVAEAGAALLLRPRPRAVLNAIKAIGLDSLLFFPPVAVP